MKAMMIALALSIAGIANAADFTYAPATDGTFFCVNYCVGYETSDPAHTVDFINIWTAGGQLVMTVDGKTYRGALANGRQVVATATDGTYILATVNWTSRTTCVRSGRGQRCTTYNYANLPGAVSVP